MKRTILSICTVIFILSAKAQTLYVPNGTNGIGTASNGNVGVGTSSPAVKLEVNGDINVGVNNSSKTTAVYGNRLYFLGAYHGSDHIWAARYNTTSNASELRINIGDDNQAGDKFVIGNNYFGDGVWYPKFTVQMNGNVGIGTTSPSTNLHIYNSTAMTRILVQTAAASQASIDLRNKIRMYRLIAQTNGRFDIYDQSCGAYRFCINTSGNVGIGTTNPKAKLAVNGTIISSEIKVLTDISQYPDFVFSDNYKLRSIKEVEKYIEENNHLPDIPKTDEVADGIELGQMNVKLLQKVEELTLYIIAQNKEIEKLKETLQQNGIK